MRMVIILLFISASAWAGEDVRLNYYLSRDHTFSNVMNDLKKVTRDQIVFINKLYAKNTKKKENLTRFQNLTWPDEKEMMAYYMNKIIRE